jgi:hypothetical protein
MLADWETKGIRQYKVEKFTISSSGGFTTGAQSVTMSARVMRVLHAVHRNTSGIDTTLHKVSRSDYDILSDKDLAGDRPDRYFLDRQRDAAILYLWPAINVSTDSLIATCLVTHQDVGNMSDNPDISRLWWEAFASGLAAKLAEKYAPERLTEKVSLAQAAFVAARSEDRDDSATRFKMRQRR